jgi:hypothetical protein
MVPKPDVGTIDRGQGIKLRWRSDRGGVAPAPA